MFLLHLFRGGSELRPPRSGRTCRRSLRGQSSCRRETVSELHDDKVSTCGRSETIRHVSICVLMFVTFKPKNAMSAVCFPRILLAGRAKARGIIELSPSPLSLLMCSHRSFHALFRQPVFPIIPSSPQPPLVLGPLGIDPTPEVDVVINLKRIQDLESRL